MERTFKVIAENGIHARPATNLVTQAMKFKSDVWLIANNRSVDMKSIMGVMSLGIYKAATFTIRTSGEDEQEALEAITNLLIKDNLGVIYE
ncbi:phosphocarrier protein [Acholeplasma morum]|jgi:phosphocarrier protein|nr:phosphocarrier protein [Paracholeplasma morum]